MVETVVLLLIEPVMRARISTINSNKKKRRTACTVLFCLEGEEADSADPLVAGSMVNPLLLTEKSRLTRR